jgi:hypothetical protein
MTRTRRNIPRAFAAAGAVWLALALSACATARLPPPSGAVIAEARAARTYSARVSVSLRGPELRARTRALLAFSRPGALRIEIPGPTGARLVAVVREGRLTAVFPGERAFFEGGATASELEALLGVSLAPGEVMDVLVGHGSPRLREYEVRWGPRLPRELKAVLPDGARLSLKIEDSEAGMSLPEEAFAVPPRTGYRLLALEEARRLWSRP